MAWRFFHNEPPWLENRIEGLLGTFFEPDENGQNMVDMIGVRLGASIKGGLMGHRSGEVRHEKALEKRVLQAVMDKSPEMKIGMQVLEEVGLGDLATPENMPALMTLAKKYGVFDMIPGLLKGNSPGESGHGYGEM